MRDPDWTNPRPATRGVPPDDHRDDAAVDCRDLQKPGGRPAHAPRQAMEQTVALELSTPWTLRRVRACLLA